jgi:AraC-like DNA-binding protein
MSASQYISRFRMTKAANDLRSGKDNMVQIACDVGFTDVKYFYRCFKKEFEITPYQYIEMLRKNKT